MSISRHRLSVLTAFGALATGGLVLLVGLGTGQSGASARPLAPNRPGSTKPMSPAKVADLSPAAPIAAGCVDEDGDGFGVNCAAGADCNDHDANVHPGARELCNFRDDDCNALVDDSPSCATPKVNEGRVAVTAGPFSMGTTKGNADESPIHVVDVSAFELDRYEVTNVRYAACVKAGKCEKPAFAGSTKRPNYFENATFADYPVLFVGYRQAENFCRFAGGRLPTEAEWELAAKGREDSRTFPWGETAPDCSRANMGGKGSCVGDTDRVGRREAGMSPFGAYDMAGNVWEWTSDFYDSEYYKKSPTKDPHGPASGALKVLRGGCWVSDANSLRTTCRKPELPDSLAPNVGFRCAYPASSTVGGGK